MNRSLLLPEFGEAVQEKNLPLAALAGGAKAAAQTRRADLSAALVPHGISDRLAPLCRRQLRRPDQNRQRDRHG